MIFDGKMTSSEDHPGLPKLNISDLEDRGHDFDLRQNFALLRERESFPSS
jgi:hypothetical protein